MRMKQELTLGQYTIHFMIVNDRFVLLLADGDSVKSIDHIKKMEQHRVTCCVSP
ncbi:hypothetical protein MACH08_01370 [Oceanobacillus kimchii]|uniref:Uncharacterized protein n=1 Tax=Oceanobacillus kimchii TaxID=746691 RepID=A0ABQ5TCP0_9BACI|nr:hypothetical protein MACH08_01370 [Oceanobacillus kimchii]